jgi:hypothetical protein
MAMIINETLKALLGDNAKDFEELFKDKNVVIELQENDIPKGRFDEVNGQVKDYKSQVAERDKQLADLMPKVKGHDELSKQLADLSELNKKTVSEYEGKIAKRERDYLLTDVLKSQKARNPKAIMPFIDESKLVVKDGKIEGLDDQLAELRKTDSYLFDEVQKVPPNAGREPNPNNPNIIATGKPVFTPDDPIAKAMGLVKDEKNKLNERS